MSTKRKTGPEWDKYYADLEVWKAKVRQDRANQKAAWEEHFLLHPEQGLPGAEVRRQVPVKEADLWADILWNLPLPPGQCFDLEPA